MAKKRYSDWRKQSQTAQMRKKLAPVNPILCVAGIACALAAARRGGLWMLAALVVEAAAMGVYFAFPQYFTILDSKTFHKTGSKAEVHDLICAMLIPTLGLAMGPIRYEILNTPVLIVIWLVVTGVLVVLFLRFSREVREEGYGLLAAAIISAFLAFGLVIQGNHHLNFDPAQPQICTLVEKDTSRSGRRRNYLISVTRTDSGDTLVLPVTGTQYEQVQVGDQIPICIDTGAFGIEYAYFAAEE